jgi:1-acyl-sn-glycerol-3-phosphate acyltransferase
VKRTMYNTPILRPIIVAICQLSLKLRGWKLQGMPPTEPKYVLIAVTHTSNWDFPLSLAMAFVYRFDMHWMGKDSLFKGWRGPIMRWMGGIPIDRSSSNNVVAQTIEAFNLSDRLVIAVPPEGTRSKVDKWKTGFYYIALGAKVPIALGFLDYKRKAGGFLSAFYPTGDAEKDIVAMRGCYAGISGKNTSQCTVE